MTWTKLSDDYGEDCYTLSDRAFRLHTEALIWSNRKLLDCVIPKDDLRRFAKHPDAALELVHANWWTETPSAYVIRHHAGYQQSREQVLKRQEINAANGRRGGRPPRERATRPKPEETHSVSESLTHEETHRDGTGRDRLLEDEPSTEGWPAVRLVGGSG